MEYRPLFLFLTVAVLAADSQAQLSVPGLTPGQSTRSDVEQALGKPVREVSGTLSEYKSPAGPNKVYVQFSASGQTAERIEILLSEKIDRSKAAAELGLPSAATETKVNSRSRLEEYFSVKNVVVTHEGTDAASPISRIAFYSPKLFAAAAGMKSTAEGQKQPAVMGERTPPPNLPFGPTGDSEVVITTRDGGAMQLTDEDKKNLIKVLKLPADANFVSTGKEGEYSIPQESGD